MARSPLVSLRFPLGSPRALERDASSRRCREGKFGRRYHGCLPRQLRQAIWGHCQPLGILLEDAPERSRSGPLSRQRAEMTTPGLWIGCGNARGAAREALGLAGRLGAARIPRTLPPVSHRAPRPGSAPHPCLRPLRRSLLSSAPGSLREQRRKGIRASFPARGFIWERQSSGSAYGGPQPPGSLVLGWGATRRFPAVRCPLVAARVPARPGPTPRCGSPGPGRLQGRWLWTGRASQRR